MEVRQYQERDAAKWDELVARSRNGTVMHTRAFLSYHGERFTDCSLVAADGGRWRAVMPAADVGHGSYRELRSHPGATYGGVVIASDCSAEETFEVVRLISHYAGLRGFAAIEARLPEHVCHREPSEEVESAMLARGYTLVAQELSTAVRVDALADRESWDEWMLAAGFSTNARRNFRKAEAAGVQPVRLITFSRCRYADFWRILTANLERHNVRPTHSIEEIERLTTLLPGCIDLWYAEHDREMVAGILTVKMSKACLHTFYFGARESAKLMLPHFRLVPALLAHAAGAGYRWVNFGVSTEQRGTVMNWGLFRFKEGFGGGGALRRTFRVEL